MNTEVLRTCTDAVSQEFCSELERTVQDMADLFPHWVSGPDIDNPQLLARLNQELKLKKTIKGQPFRIRRVPHYNGQVLEITVKYVLRQRIGEGGMGEVWAAEEPMVRGGKMRAVKFINFEIEGDNEQLLEEGRVSLELDHPNVVDVEGNYRVGNECFMSMNFVDGGRDFRDLQVQLRQVRGNGTIDYNYLLRRSAIQIPAEMVEHFGIMLSEALKHSHKKGLIHRDVKPANAMVDVEGRVRLTDFGIAVPMTDQAGRESISGTPVYMSPETFNRDQAVDERTDIWSLGITLYELITGGITPFDASLDRVADFNVRTPLQQAGYMYMQFERIRRGEIRIAAPHEVVKNVHLGLSDIVMRCLEIDRDDRIQSMAELASALKSDLYSPGEGPTGSSWEALLRIYDTFNREHSDAEVLEAFSAENRANLKFLIDKYRPAGHKERSFLRKLIDRAKDWAKKYVYDDDPAKRARQYKDTNFRGDYMTLPDGSSLKERIIQYLELTDDARHRLECGQHPGIISTPEQERKSNKVRKPGSQHITYTP